MYNNTIESIIEEAREQIPEDYNEELCVVLVTDSWGNAFNVVFMQIEIVPGTKMWDFSKLC